MIPDGFTEQVEPLPQLSNSDKTQQPFLPGGIHAPECQFFWEHTLKANVWVLDLLKHGYSLPFLTEPEASNTRNNLSARNNMQFVREEVLKLQKTGVVSFVDQAPTIVSPLTVASNSGGKLRLCLDVSRSVNQFLNIPKVVLADLKTALQITEPGDWQAVYDLSSAYHHIKILPAHVKYLGAAFQREDGSTQYFVFNFLPFGISSAVHVMTKVMKPFSAFLSSLGIRHTIYLDDGRVCSHSKEQAAKDLETVYFFLKKAGWVIALKKSDTVDSIDQNKHYLGFKIDSKSMRVFLQPQKQADLISIVLTLVKALNRFVTLKFLAKVLGKMISCAPALGNIPLIFARQGYFLLDQTVEAKGWSAKVKISKSVVDSLKQFLKILPSFDGQPIMHSANSISLISIIGPPEDFISESFVKIHTPSLPKEIFVSDASNVAVCSYSMNTIQPFFFIGQLIDWQTKVSSGHRELLAVEMALDAKLKSSGPWPAQTNMKREDPRIKVADAGSRVRDSDDWSIDSMTFQALAKEFGPFTLDPFADCSNDKTERFFSDFLCPNTMGINAFAHSWDHENVWLCPPTSKIIPTIRKIRNSVLSGVLIVPDWKAAPFWPMLFPSATNNNSFIKNVRQIYPIIVQNQRALSPLSGKTPFSFLLIQIQN